MKQIVRAIVGCCLLSASGATPRPPKALEDLVRSVLALPTYAEARNRTPPLNVRRHDAEVLRFDRLPWEKIDLDAIASGKYAPNPGGSYGVRVLVSCHPGDAPARESRVLWYVFAEGHLASFDHFEFTEACNVRGAFRRAPSVATDIDFLVFLRDGNRPSPPAGPCAAIEAYGRALVYAEVGRWEEARSLVADGDQELHLDPAGRLQGTAMGGECIDEAQTLRSATTRQLERGPPAAAPAWPSSP